MKKIIVSVSNDVFNDNRVEKTCNSLCKYGLNVFLVGKRTKDSPKLPKKHFAVYRMKTLCKKNVFYYMELNIRLFFFLLFKRTDILWANDLDTLLPNYLVSKIKNKPLIFDSHELFWAIAELKDTRIKREFWRLLERKMVPNIKYVITVCEPIKKYFQKNYKVNASLVRNIPLFEEKNQERKCFPLKEKIIVWQGSANVDRGLEELVLAMKNVDAKLYIIGRGDIVDNLKQEIIDNDLKNKVFLFGRLTFDEMMAYTRRATIAISIDKPTNKNYEISLPNKIFEYINSATPIVCTPLKEIEAVVKKYDVGFVIKDFSVDNLSKQINEIINNDSLLQKKSDNCILAQKELSWQNEEQHIFEVLNKIQEK
ncbi:MAG: glycosyltransferase [Bacteroidales bacterium]|jgi:glycosyltransferase involved in cell wall biosynthesis|nr:glycosyltransferase [Bacteroidales bacterium]